MGVLFGQHTVWHCYVGTATDMLYVHPIVIEVQAGHIISAKGPKHTLQFQVDCYSSEGFFGEPCIR